jgi:hypothetical protein
MQDKTCRTAMYIGKLHDETAHGGEKQGMAAKETFV